MSEWSGFFDAHLVDGVYDRTYLAEHFAKYFAKFVGNGVFANVADSLQVFQTATASMSVLVSPGSSWIEGYTYENDADLALILNPADGALDRIDLIVNRWSAADRRIKTVVKTGVPAINATAPSLQRDADYKELKLAEIRVRAGATNITQSSITDYRADASVCGWVTGLLEQVDTTTLFNQWRTAYEEEYSRTSDYLVAQKAAWEQFFRSVQLDLALPAPSLEEAGYCIRVNAAGSGYELIKTRTESPAILRASFWEGDAAPYTQSIRVEGLVDACGVNIFPSYGGTLAEKEAAAEAYAEIRCATRSGDTITFECWENTPSINLPIIVEVIR